MRIRSHRAVFLAKLALATLALTALIALAARELVPAKPLGMLLRRVAIWLMVGLALSTLLAIGSLQFYQFILRKGGTDAQWFWFSSEPRGLVALRQGKAVDDGSSDA